MVGGVCHLPGPVEPIRRATDVSRVDVRLPTEMTSHRSERKGGRVPERNSGPEAAIEGVVEEVKGKVKEAAGVLTGQDELRREGRAQQEKAEASRDVAKKEAEAEKARAVASAREAEQRSHQD